MNNSDHPPQPGTVAEKPSGPLYAMRDIHHDGEVIKAGEAMPEGFPASSLARLIAEKDVSPSKPGKTIIERKGASVAKPINAATNAV